MRMKRLLRADLVVSENNLIVSVKAPVMLTVCQISAFAFVSLFSRTSLLFIRHSTHYINALFLDGKSVLSANDETLFSWLR